MLTFLMICHLVTVLKELPNNLATIPNINIFLFKCQVWIWSIYYYYLN